MSDNCDCPERIKRLAKAQKTFLEQFGLCCFISICCIFASLVAIGIENLQDLLFALSISFCIPFAFITAKAMHSRTPDKAPAPPEDGR